MKKIIILKVKEPVSAKNLNNQVEKTKKLVSTDKKATPADVAVVSEIFTKMADVKDATPEVKF